MTDLQERLDGIQRWFYGGEPGLDDLPLADDADTTAPLPDDLSSGVHLCSACAQALQQR